jgi:acyl-CoA reductase-like NAD-dependent aldehyde dehydrogenase
MTERHPLQLDATAGPGGRSWLDVSSPFDGSVIGEVELGGPDDAEHVLGTLHALARDPGARLPPHERIAVLRRAAAIMRDRHDELARRIASEGGKPLADARVETDRAIDGVELCAEEARRLHGTEIPMGATPASAGRLAVTTREPIGVVVAVSAFNHPLNLIVHQVAPAVATGCPVVVKPASATPLSCLAFVDILREAGLPPGWCIALPTPGRVAEQLVTSDRTAFFSFIGSATVGWRLRSKLAPGVRCALEHGGVAPLIVDASADLDAAVPLIAKGGYYHAGQVCVSVQRVFAHRLVLAELTERLTAAVAALRTGDPLDPETEVGPLIAAAEVERVHEWVTEAVAAGATLAIGGERIGHQCYAPTLLVDTPDDARTMREEVFGPVVNVVGFDDLDDAIDRANAVPWAFQASILTQDVDRALRAGRRLDATAVMVNDHTAFRVDWMPFGGRRHSGLGLGGMAYTMEEMTQLKMLVLREGLP